VLATALVWPTAARAQEPLIDELRIWVQDMHTKEDREFLAPGSTLYLEQGDKVRLRIQAIPRERNRKPRYPRARWTPAGSQQEIRFSEFDERVGTVVVEARSVNPNVRSGVRFQLLDRMNLARGVNSSGGMTIEVSGGRNGYNSGGGYSSGGGHHGYNDHNASQSQTVVRSLYRGILMREAEPQAVAERSRKIDAGGYGTAVSEAQAIAASRESRIDVYARGVTNEQRLLTLYEELLGLDRQRINTRSWEDNLRGLANGDIVGVVTAMVRSEEFRRKYGYPTARRY
jgi:hypothetical protein